MIWNILQLIFCITLFVLPLALYKSHRSFMVRFYDAMIHSVKARKLYVQVVLILLLLFHYVYISGHVGEFGVFLSTAICATIYSFRRADRLLRGLCDRPCMFVILSLVALATLVHNGGNCRLSSFGCPVLSLCSGYDRISGHRHNL